MRRPYPVLSPRVACIVSQGGRAPTGRTHRTSIQCTYGVIQKGENALGQGESRELGVLVIAIGNPSRRDDGAGLYIIRELRQRLGLAAPADALSFSAAPEIEESGDIATLCLQQLGPELAEAVSRCTLVVFVDAHTGAYAEDLRTADLAPSFSSAAFTHHMEPATLLALSKSLYGRAPRALSISIRGHDFDFGTELSAETTQLADKAVQVLWDIIHAPRSQAPEAANGLS